MALYNILFDIAARTAKFEEGMTRVDRRLENMQRSAGKMGQSLKNLFVVGGAAAFIKEMAAAGDDMKTLAERTGRSVESLSQLKYVAERGNTSLESLIKGQDQLAKKMGATDDEGKAVVKVLDEIGLSADALRAMSPDQQLDAIADAMGSITDPTTRARIAMVLFGKAGTELLPVLKSGSGGIKDLREEADRLGITMDTLTADRLSALDDQFEKLKGQTRGLSLELGGLLAGPLTGLSEFFAQGIAGWNVWLGNVGEVERLRQEYERLDEEQRRLVETNRQINRADDIERNNRRIEQIKREKIAVAELQDAWIQQPRLLAKLEADEARIRGKQLAASEAAAAKLEAEKQAAEKVAAAYAKWLVELKAIVAHERMLNDLELKYPTPVIDDAEFERTISKTSDMIEKGAKEDQKVLDAIYKENADNFGDAMGEMSVYAEQASRNIESYLADYLFDPFDKGIKGMLRGFVDVIRRMVAEAGSAKILEALGLGRSSGGGFLGSVLGSLFGGLGSGSGSGGTGTFKGFAAKGMSLSPGEWAIAGETGQPEAVYGGKAGATIIPFQKGSTSSRAVTVAPVFHNEIHVHGTRNGVTPEDLMHAVDQANRASIAHMTELIKGGAFA